MSFAYRERAAGEHLLDGSEHCAYHRLVAGRGPSLQAVTVTVTHWFGWCFRIEVRKVGLSMFPFRSNTEVVVK
jgi:hypothetical protein